MQQLLWLHTYDADVFELMPVEPLQQGVTLSHRNQQFEFYCWFVAVLFVEAATKCKKTVYGHRLFGKHLVIIGDPIVFGRQIRLYKLLIFNMLICFWQGFLRWIRSDIDKIFVFQISAKGC